jgi:hypothetical protein
MAAFRSNHQWLEGSCKSEVADLDVLVLVKEYVLWLQVSMDDSRLMDGDDSIDDLGEYLKIKPLVYSLPAVQIVLEGLS